MERTLSVQKRTQDKQTTDNSETGRETEALRMRFPYWEEEIVCGQRKYLLSNSSHSKEPEKQGNTTVSREACFVPKGCPGL